MRVQAIANQLNPHFINNTLNMIQLKNRDNADAVDMIDRLSQNIQIVFRNTRNKKGEACAQRSTMRDRFPETSCATGLMPGQYI